MTAADVAALYLPLSGGAMSGDISNAGTGMLRLLGGTSTNNGARLAVAHENNAQFPGEFWLVAKATGIGEKDLIGKPDGSLTWDGKVVACFANFSSGAAGYARFTNGLQLCWNYDNISEANKNSGKAITYALPFSSIPRLMLSLRPGSAHTSCDVPIAYPTSSTGATVYMNNPNGRAFGQFSYLAVGTY